MLLFVSQILGTTLELLASSTACRLLPAAILASDLAVASVPEFVSAVASVLPDTVLSEAGVSVVAGVLAVAAILIASGDIYLKFCKINSVELYIMRT